KSFSDSFLIIRHLQLFHQSSTPIFPRNPLSLKGFSRWRSTISSCIIFVHFYRSMSEGAQMKLSSDMQEWVRKKKLQEIGELAKLRDIEIKRISSSTPRSGAQISAIADQHINFNQRTIEIIVNAYLEAYKLEEKVMDTDVIQGIVAEILYPWQ